MNNYERIKNMTIEEMVQLFMSIRYDLLCNYCLGCAMDDDNNPITCLEQVKKWLESEVSDENRD